VLIRDVIVSTGVPTLLVTHDPDEADELGDVIIGYAEGRVTGMRSVEHGATTEPAADGPEESEPA